MSLVPPRFRQRARGVIAALGEGVRRWLLGQLILMVLVGVLSLASVWLIGLPNPLALGFVAGVTEIVPYVGPIVGGALAISVALTQGWVATAWTVAAYIGIHIIEGYVVAPLLQQRFVDVPPALMILGIAAAAVLFGAAGVILGAPIVVTIFLLVKLLYVKWLDDPDGGA